MLSFLSKEGRSTRSISMLSQEVETAHPGYGSTRTSFSGSPPSFPLDIVSREEAATGLGVWEPPAPQHTQLWQRRNNDVSTQASPDAVQILSEGKQLCNHFSRLGRKWLLLQDFFFQKQIWGSGCDVTPRNVNVGINFIPPP